MFDQIKFLMQDGERYIVVEGGRPEYVFMRFDDYASIVKGKTGNPGHNTPAKNTGAWEKVNSELEEFGSCAQAAHSDFITESTQAGVDPVTIRLEDLPL